MYIDRPAPPAPLHTPIIQDVWAHNLHEEFREIRMLIRDVKEFFVAMDTEFPGIVIKQEGNERNNYRLIRDNCNCLRVIQIGLSILNTGGISLHEKSTWQFNFKFNIDKDRSAEDSITMLKNSGIPFERLKTDGIEWNDFGELLLSSGLVCSENVHWLTFHGGSDMGYMYRLLSGRNLPNTEREFFDELERYFPSFYDIKSMMEGLKDPRVKGGLQSLANYLHVVRFGDAHHAGSDSLLTGQTFFAAINAYYDDCIDTLFNGCLYSLEESYIQALNDKIEDLDNIIEIKNIPVPPPLPDNERSYA